jgi:asparagine synthase (glutamine-hydrolysing)
MGAQAGIFNFDGKPIDRDLVKAFGGLVGNQDPDAELWYVSGPVALLCRPFHTTRESRHERQPHSSDRGFVITWDGRLDNREDLLVRLRLDPKTDWTDLGIVAATFDRWETDCFEKLIGDWAICVWNPESQELVLACDFMCIRHIFYYLKPDHIWWATDLTSLLMLSGECLGLDDDYIAGYLANDPESHLTPYRDIRQVPAGSFVRISNRTSSVRRHWQCGVQPRIHYKTDAEYEDHFRHVFRQSVRRRLRSDSPVLAELSGGLDSSSIVCMADDIQLTSGVQAPRLDTISYYDKTETNGEDRLYFERVEHKRGRVGKHIDASTSGRGSFSSDHSDFSPVPGYIGTGREFTAERSAAICAGGYRVVLSGTGGDEFMGGVPDPRAQLADLIVQLSLRRLARDLMEWSLVKRRPWIQLLWQSALELVPSSLRATFIKEARPEFWINSKFARRTRLACRRIDVDEHFGLWLPTRRRSAATVLSMSNKMAKRVSRTPMIEEVRYPFLDQNLVEFVLAIPATQLLRPGERRSLMRRGLKGIVPKEILSRQTKQFGARTLILALEENWQPLLAALDRPLSSRLGFVDRDAFIVALSETVSGKTLSVTRILKAVSLEFWLRDLVRRHILRDQSVSGLERVKKPLQV